MENKIVIRDDAIWQEVFRKLEAICIESQLPTADLIGMLEILKHHFNHDLINSSLEEGEEE